jgi:hypothetical protein
MPNTVQSSSKYRKAAADFFAEARAAWCDTPKKQRKGFVKPYRIDGDVVYGVTRNIALSERQLLTVCLELLGARSMLKEALGVIVWELVEASLKETDVNSASANFVRDLATRAYADSNAEYRYVRPNYLIRFARKLTVITVGPVTALLASEAIAEIKANFPDLRATLRVGKDFKLDPKLGTESPAVIDLPVVVWMVKVNSTRALVEQEARWRVDVAVSLLRLFYPNRYYPHFPRPGDLETDPFLKPSFANEGIKFSNDNLFAGGMQAPFHYIVDPAVVRIIRGARFRSLADAIFQAEEKKVSERVARSLGWLSRARQAQDPAERFLFFFTSIEALLSSQTDGAPITQTIARHAAVILTNDVEKRQELSELLQKLYKERSALVHRGSRNVQREDVNIVQVLAESLCSCTLHRVDLRMTFTEFEATLRTASFGAKWKMPLRSRVSSAPAC